MSAFFKTLRSVPLPQFPCQWLGFQPSCGSPKRGFPQEREGFRRSLLTPIASTNNWLVSAMGLLRPSVLGAKVPKALGRPGVESQLLHSFALCKAPNPLSAVPLLVSDKEK